VLEPARQDTKARCAVLVSLSTSYPLDPPFLTPPFDSTRLHPSTPSFQQPNRACAAARRCSRCRPKSEDDPPGRAQEAGHTLTITPDVLPAGPSTRTRSRSSAISPRTWAARSSTRSLVNDRPEYAPRPHSSPRQEYPHPGGRRRRHHSDQRRRRPADGMNEQHVHCPELIFRHMLTSTNYEAVAVLGPSGIGSKACNVEHAVLAGDGRRRRPQAVPTGVEATT
jgi:hypothetical protein